MKERYLTPENIEAVSRRILDDLAVVRSRREPRFEPPRAALVILDMQRYFTDPASHAFVPSAPAIIPRIKSLADAFRAKGLPVALTKHQNTPDDAGMMGVWWKELIDPASDAAEIVPELDTLDAAVFEKTQYDAFFGSGLETMLADRGARQVVIAGVMTHLCCETTVRSAFMRGFAVFAAVDCMADYNELFHRASLMNMAHGFAVPVMAGDLADAIGGGGDGGE
jgi:isochorismate hydrolase